MSVVANKRKPQKRVHMYRDNLMYFKKKTFDINMKQSEELKSPLYVVHG